jgi:2-dehydro-3-deoxygalactonokinase
MSASAATATHPFLSCDWGTSAFRLRLVDAKTRRVIAESRGPEGIAATFAEWNTAGAKAEDRWGHFSRVIARHLARVREKSGTSLAGIPLVISGMASSSIGMRELPYREMPFTTDGSDLRVERIAARADFPHPLLIISGARCSDDVMRGEETQLVGACANDAASGHATATTRLYLLPGTHSKHVEVRAAHAVTFRTYMTGEFFDLLSRKSVLASSVGAESALVAGETLRAFEAGVEAGVAENLLHACFRVRTRALLDRAAPAENFHYLSGLLLGAEVREIAAQDGAITLVGGGPLLAAYQHAFRTLRSRVALTVQDVDDCLIAGQLTIATRVGLL